VYRVYKYSAVRVFGVIVVFHFPYIVSDFSPDIIPPESGFVNRFQ